MQIPNVRTGLRFLDDDWCGTKPRPLPFPWPGPKGPQFLDRGSLVGLNPQPLPPRELSSLLRSVLNRGSLVGFNPQPEPPKAKAFWDDFCGTKVPRRPPLPDPPPFDVLNSRIQLR